AAEQAVQDADLLVDAIFGTGLKGTVKGLAAGVIETINRCGRPVVAVDIPSGLDADGGKSSGPCVQATTTMTFGLPKIGQVFYPGKSKCGRLIVAEIGYPPEVIEEERCRTNLVTGEEVAQLLPRRAPDAYKGSCGRIAIVAGSVGMTGAAALASMAALRIGAGLVTLGLPASLNDILEVKLTEVITKPLPEVRKRRCIALRAIGEIRRMLHDVQCLAIGPGLGTHHETAEMVRRIVAREIEIPTVIDADGLNALAKDISSLRETGAEIVITPHAGELSRLTGRPIAEITASPLKAAESFAQEFKLTVVLKGAPTVIATSDAELYVNSTGNAGMATAGSGDVLTGTIVGLIGQGLTPAEAAIAGVFIHGKAGDLARQQKGEMGLVAGDILQFLPDA
ncbi:MAG: NAD(P)H-hydrate dehydratase, partial [Candidatus Latescibacteria bacterium]|nr:NAD(P)H-hydrate dehydratase [Candidatus Latescibacterota bacterium]